MDNKKSFFKLFNKKYTDLDKDLYKEINKKNKIKNPWTTLKKIISLYKGYRRRFVFAMILIFIGFLLTLFGTLNLKNIVDSLIQGEYLGFSHHLVLFSVFMFAGSILNYIGTASKAVIAQEITYDLRKKAFKHLETLNISYFDKNQSGDVISIFINDIELLSTALDQAIPEIFIALSQIIVVLFILFVLNPVLATIIVIATFFYVLITFVFMKKANLYSIVMTNRLAEMNSFLEENLSGISTIKTFNYEEDSLKLFEEKSDLFCGSEGRAFYFSRTVDAVTNSFTVLLSAIIIMIGSVMVISELISLGLLVTYEQLIQQLTGPIRLLAQQAQTLIMSIAGAERLNTILSQEPEIDQGHVFLEKKDDVLYWNDNGRLIPAKGAIEFKNVNFAYDKDSLDDLILEDITLNVKSGEKIAFVGSTGAGKTTIVNLVNRFYEINSGSITFDNIDIRDIKKKDLRSVIAAVLQDTNLFTGTIMENIKNGNLYATDEDAINAAKISNADYFINNLPDKYNTLINTDDISLSQGEMQLLSIARAIIAKPLVLILDEATSSIDTKTEMLIQEALDNLTKNTTSLVVAHRLSTIKDSNSIMVIDDGRIIESGNHNDLFALKEKYYNLYTGKEFLI